MPRSVCVPVLVTVAVLLISGCSGGDEPTASSPPAESSSIQPTGTTAPEPQRPPAGNPCVGTQGPCEVVASVDVDGDGNSDNVGVELVSDRITVRIDNGSELTTASVPNKHIFADDLTPAGVFVGAYNITRAEGADIVVDAKMGLGGSELFGVIGWDNGPVLVPAPQGDTNSVETAYLWAVPTEMYRVFVRCPEPGTVGVVKTEADSSFGVVTPGGAYTETKTSQWRGDAWEVVNIDRIPGQYESADKSAQTGTFECVPAHTDPPTFAPVVAPENPNIVLGGAPISYSEGYGEVRPPTVYFGGSPSGYIGDIVWESWGGERAVGHGTAPYVTPTGSVAEAEMTPAEIVAFEPSTCDGEYAYAKVQWYFPGEGQSFDPSLASGVC